MKLKKIILIIAVVGLQMACAKKASSPNAPTNPVTDPIGTTPISPDTGTSSGSPLSGGTSVSFTFTDAAAFEEYTGGRPMNNPQNIQLHVSLKEKGLAFGGKIAVSYVDNDNKRSASFSSGTSDSDNVYNLWADLEGKRVWRGLFEDSNGGVVLVIDEVIDLGDGQGAQNTVGGSVWFKNFNLGVPRAPQPPTRCWFVRVGPYDCRPWPDGDGMFIERSINPGAGYVKLGEFKDLKLDEAFNGDFSF